ncbi:MAG: tRNA (N(6)-L-threonylcarbamoyladenosine(37)-C(2))-methylthiotransferase MtaB [Candidatus Eisenbacteria bacterium]
MPRASVHTLGCRLNQAESAVLLDGLRSRGFTIVAESERADLYVVNTCSVTRGSEAKCRRLIRLLRKRSPGARVVVTGCYAELEPDRIRSIGGIDLVVGTAEKHRLPDLVGSIEGHPPVVRGRPDRSPFAVEGTGLFAETRANLKIQDGCDEFCTFCVIPLTRGRARSRRAADCLRETEGLAARGHREIVLSGVNIGTYEDEGIDLSGLIDRLEGVPGIERIRIGSIEPMTAGEKLVARMERGGKLVPYLHLCLQSGDDEVLGAMGRPYTASSYSALFREIVARVPEAGIGTDVLVGFPGESEDAYRTTFDLLESLPFYHFHVFPYSEHPRTRSAVLPGKVRPDIIRRRADGVRALGAMKKRRFHERFVGQTLDVLFETRDRGGLWIGHAPNYARVAARFEGDLANRIARVRVESALVPEARGTVEEILG